MKRLFIGLVLSAVKQFKDRQLLYLSDYLVSLIVIVNISLLAPDSLCLRTGQNKTASVMQSEQAANFTQALH